jgi:hypothetical protein
MHFNQKPAHTIARVFELTGMDYPPDLTFASICV